MYALKKTGVWSLVSLLKRKKNLDKNKFFPSNTGFIDRYKATLVVKMYTQILVIVYQVTFSPVAKLNTIKVMVSFKVKIN